MNGISGTPQQPPPTAAVTTTRSREQSQDVRLTRQTRREAAAQVDITIKEITTRIQDITEQRRPLAARTREPNPQIEKQQESSGSTEIAKPETSPGQRVDTSKAVAIEAAQNLRKTFLTVNNAAEPTGSLIDRVI